MQVNFTFGRITATGVQVLHQHQMSTSSVPPLRTQDLDNEAECARRILAALMTNTPQEQEQARAKATDGYAIAADVLEGSEV